MKKQDDFDWNTYSEGYERELHCFNLGDAPRDLKKLDRIAQSVEENNGELVFKDNLHPNNLEIYHQIHALGIKSVFECGCGCASNLISIKNIMPKVHVGGCDYSADQIELGYKYFKLKEYDFAKNLSVTDLTIPGAVDIFGTHELVFTSAVVMHLEHHRALAFLKNMKELSSEYVLLAENFSVAHNWDSLTQEAFPASEFDRLENKKYQPGILLLKRRGYE